MLRVNLLVSIFTESDIGVDGSQHVKDQNTVQQDEAILTNESVIQEIQCSRSEASQYRKP